MERVDVTINGYSVDFDTARQVAALLASRDNEYTTLVAWSDRKRNTHSPQCLKCEIKGEPGWEVYGRNHAGRLRISFNDDLFVFIYS
ncbi:AF1514 family protein [Desulfolithobacter sp.]